MFGRKSKEERREEKRERKAERREEKQAEKEEKKGFISRFIANEKEEYEDLKKTPWWKSPYKDGHWNWYEHKWND